MGRTEADAAGLRERLRRARLMLLFTPGLCARDPLATLAATLPWVDAIQVRIKHPEDPAWNSPARESLEWAERVLDLVAASPHDPLVLVNDRVDVAACLVPLGLAGVHLGDEDCPPAVAREELGAGPLIGLSTHGARDVAAALAEPVDYLGYGPIHATATKGYARGLGAEAAWIAGAASPIPVFPIGGIDVANVAQLAPVGRAAVSAAILMADDPARTARELCEMLLP